MDKVKIYCAFSYEEIGLIMAALYDQELYLLDIDEVELADQIHKIQLKLETEVTWTNTN